MARLIDISQLTKNLPLSKTNFETTQDNIKSIPLIQIKNINDSDEIHISENTNHIRPIDNINLSQFGDICIVTSGPKSGLVLQNEFNFPVVFSNHFVVVKSDDPNLYELLKSKESQIKALAKGSAMVHISRKDLGEIEI
jgi:restriction endonuclease S subunit